MKTILTTLIFALIIFVPNVSIPANDVQTHRSIEAIELERNIDQLLLLMQKRLVIMHEVVRTKWNQNLPIEDKERDLQILKGFAAQASQYQLEEQWVTQFFLAQINAAKLLQKNDFDQWQKEGRPKFEKVLNLKDDLRSYIDRINQEIMVLLSKVYHNDINTMILNQPLSNRSSDHIESEVWQLAISPLR